MGFVASFSVVLLEWRQHGINAISFVPMAKGQRGVIDHDIILMSYYYIDVLMMS